MSAVSLFPRGSRKKRVYLVPSNWSDSAGSEPCWYNLDEAAFKSFGGAVLSLPPGFYFRVLA